MTTVESRLGKTPNVTPEREKDEVFYQDRLGLDWRDRIRTHLEKRGLLEEGQELEYHVPPLRHENSKAGYLVDYYHGKDRILISDIDPHSETSTHFHFPLKLRKIFKMTIERYETISGKLYVNGVEVPPEGLSIPSLLPHQATTRENHAVSLIVMENAGYFPPHLQHGHISRPLMWPFVQEVFGLTKGRKK